MEFVRTTPPEYTSWDMDNQEVTEDALVEGQLKLSEEQYSVPEEVEVVVCSWNINQKKPEAAAKLRNWMRVEQRPAVIAVGLQEVDMSANALIREETDLSKPWVEAIRTTAKGYTKAASRQLAGLLFVLLIRSDLAENVVDVSTAIVRCGAMGNSVANKGSIGVRLNLYKTSICIANAHLAAHQSEVDKRNRDFGRIVDNMHFPASSTVPMQQQVMKGNDVAFLFGDLNYRIDLPYDQTVSLIGSKNWDLLLEADQLTRVAQQPATQPLLRGFRLVQPRFPPTYKFDGGTTTYDSSEKRRIPAWTDRILYYDRSVGTVTPKIFINDEDMLVSDHRAVACTFDVKVSREVPEKKERIRAEILSKIREIGCDKYAVPNMTLSESSVSFGSCVYGACKEKTVTLTNNGHAKVIVDVFACNKALTGANASAVGGEKDKVTYSPNWLSVDPTSVRVSPGESQTITLTCMLDKLAVAELAQQSPFRNPDGVDPVLAHWLVLSCGQQKFWIEATASYTHSCFGSKLSHLASLGLTPISSAYQKPKEAQPPPPSKPLVPKELWWMVDYITKYGRQTPNLFQTDLNMQDFELVRAHLDNKCKAFEPKEVDPCSMSQILLVFLKDLQEPVVPSKLYDKCLSTQAKLSPSALPSTHFNVFMYIISFLRFLLKPENQKYNQLTPELLAQGFAPVLLQRTTFVDKSPEQLDQERIKAMQYILQLLQE